MSFPRYPEYKDSGADWLSEVPAHWEVSPLKYVARVGNGSTPSREQPEYWTGGTYPWLNSSVVNQESVTESDQFVTELALNECHLPKILPPAVLIGITGQGRTRGMASTLMIEATISQHVAYVQPNSSRASVGWIRRVVDANYNHLRDESEAGGSTKGAITCEQISALKVPLPPPLEQRAITAFLDRETAKVDALVAEQQRLIELLKGKRQTVISHAVTKGLNPDVPMKPSGVEWLGEVPAHWEVSRVKELSVFTTSGPRGWSERVGEEGALFVQSGDLNASLQVEFQSVKRVLVEDGAEAERTRLRDGDIVVCITGAKTGNVAVCTSVPGPAYVNQHLCLIRPGAEVLPVFLGTVLKSVIGQAYFEISQYGLKQGLSLEDVREAPVLLPPLGEQAAIVSWLKAETERLDALTAEAVLAIELLQERRAALISAAVTGQIDVRGLADRAAA